MFHFLVLSLLGSSDALYINFNVGIGCGGTKEIQTVKTGALSVPCSLTVHHSQADIIKAPPEVNVVRDNLSDHCNKYKGSFIKVAETLSFVFQLLTAMTRIWSMVEAALAMSQMYLIKSNARGTAN